MEEAVQGFPQGVTNMIKKFYTMVYVSMCVYG